MDHRDLASSNYEVSADVSGCKQVGGMWAHESWFDARITGCGRGRSCAKYSRYCCFCSLVLVFEQKFAHDTSLAAAPERGAPPRKRILI